MVDLLDELTGGQPDPPPSLYTVSLNGGQIVSTHIPKKIRDSFFPKAVPIGHGAQNTTSGLLSTGKIVTSKQN